MRRTATSRFGYVVAVALTIALSLFGQRSSTTQRSKKAVARPVAAPISISVAVMPFQQTVGSTDTEVLGQGIADFLGNALKGISRFTVADVETASNVIKADPAAEGAKKDEDAARVGKEMGVSFVEIGSYQIVGNQLLANCRTVNAETGQVLAGSAVSVTGRFPEDYGKLLDDLNRKVVAAFRIQPTTSEATQLGSTAASQSGKAILLYNNGLAKMREGSSASLRLAISSFAECLTADPGYAPAYAAKADAEAQLAERGKGQPEASDFAREAEQDASSAVRVRPNFGAAQRALARAHNAAGNYAAAAEAAQKALRAAPNDAATRIALNRAQNNGELVPTAEINQLLQKQPWISFLFDQFPKVLVQNDCDAILRVTFAPAHVSTPVSSAGPQLTVVPHGMRVTAVFPGTYSVTFDSDIGDLAREYELRSNQLEELKFRCSTDIQRTAVVITNQGNTAAYVTFTRGAHVTNIVVNPGGTESRDLQVGNYTITCAGSGGGRSLENRQATLRSNSRYTYQCNVMRTLVPGSRRP